MRLERMGPGPAVHSLLGDDGSCLAFNVEPQKEVLDALCLLLLMNLWRAGVMCWRGDVWLRGSVRAPLDGAHGLHAHQPLLPYGSTLPAHFEWGEGLGVSMSALKHKACPQSAAYPDKVTRSER